MRPSTATTPILKEPGAEPIPGYRLIAPLGSGGFGEVWKCEAPGGLQKAIKFVHGDNLSLHPDSASEQELRALERIKEIRHPFLLSMDRVEKVGGELMIVMELADTSLHDVLRQYQMRGQAGVPRSELLAWMRETAEVLDLMNLEYSLEHLDIKPKNLFLVRQHIKVADFGLVNSLADLNGQGSANLQLAALTPVYASPESFQGKITLYSDQYSLGIVYCELLTGQLPFSGKNFRQLALMHTQAEPDLSALPEADRPIVARALAKDPRQRFPSSGDFVRALVEQALPPAQRSSETDADVQQPKSVTLFDFNLGEKGHTVPVPKPTRIMPPQVLTQTDRPVMPPQALAQTDRATTTVGLSLNDLHFRDCLGRSPLGEMWKAEMPDGSARLVKLVNTFATGGGLFGEDELASRLQALQHRGLVPASALPHPPSRIAIVTPSLPDSLATRMQECRAQQLPGIPRRELLYYLQAAARALDEVHKLYGVAHLGLNPRNLVLLGEELKVADHGLVALVWLPAGQPVAQFNARYAAPELHQAPARAPTGAADQYSLALIYHELLTSMHLFGNMTQRQLAVAQSEGRVNLDLLPAHDRGPIARALKADPSKRFRTTRELIEALILAAPGDDDLLEEDRWTEEEAEKPTGPLLSEVLSQEGKALVAELVQQAIGDVELRECRGGFYAVLPDGTTGKRIEHHCYARLLPGTFNLKVAGFEQEWRAERMEKTTDERVYHVRLQSSFWRRCMGQQPSLEVRVKMLLPEMPQVTMSEVVIGIRPRDCKPDEGGAAMERFGPRIVDSLRLHLQVGPERRAHPRLACPSAVQVFPVLDNQRLGEELPAHAKDVSLGGMGLLLEAAPKTGQLAIRLRRPSRRSEETIAAQVVRVHPCSDGRCEVGVRFVW